MKAARARLRREARLADGGIARDVQRAIAARIEQPDVDRPSLRVHVEAEEVVGYPARNFRDRLELEIDRRERDGIGRAGGARPPQARESLTDQGAAAAAGKLKAAQRRIAEEQGFAAFSTLSSRTAKAISQ